MSSSSSNQTINGKKYGRALYPWHFDKYELLLSSPSRNDGISYDDELVMKQNCCKFLHQMVQNLSHAKGDHLACGVAAVFIHRFFRFHSLKHFDYRDIAAACFFLSGKNEDSPRKLKYLTTQWWYMKHPNRKSFESEKQYNEARNFIVQLESVVLMTLAFDMNVDLPHSHVLKMMQQIEKCRSIHKDMVKTAYYLTTDILCITDWSIRYTCTSIATATINIAAYFFDVNLFDITPPEMSKSWFREDDSNFTREVLDEMTREFLDIFAKRPDMHIGTLKRIDIHGKVKLVDQSSPVQVTSSVLPPPPAAPILAPKKVDISTYKERQRMSSATTSRDSPRQSFLPDVQNVNEMQKLAKIATEQHPYNNGHHQSHSNQQHQQMKERPRVPSGGSHQQRQSSSSGGGSSDGHHRERSNSHSKNHHHQAQAHGGAGSSSDRHQNHGMHKNGHHGARSSPLDRHHQNGQHGSGSSSASYDRHRQSPAVHVNGHHGGAGSSSSASDKHHHHQAHSNGQHGAKSSPLDRHHHNHQNHHTNGQYGAGSSSSSSDRHHTNGQSDRHRQSPAVHINGQHGSSSSSDRHRRPEHYNHHQEKEKNHHHRSQSEVDNRNKRPQGADYKNEYQMSEKRSKMESTSSGSSYESTSYKAEVKVENRSEQTTMSAYAYQVSVATKQNGSSRNGHIANKPTSAYQQMCLDMNMKNKSRQKSSDPSPPTISPPFNFQNGLAPPPPPPPPPQKTYMYSNEEMEDGEVM